MRILLALILVLGLLVGHAAALSTNQATLVTAATGNVTCTDGNCPNAVSIKGLTTVVVHVCCTFTAQVNFLASVDGTGFDAIGCVPISTNSSYVTNVTVRGLYRCNVIGINTKFGVSVSNYVSGTITVTAGMTSAGVT